MLGSMTRRDEGGPLRRRRPLGVVVVVLTLLATVATLPITPPPEWLYESAVPLDVGIGLGPLDFYEEGDPVPMERGFQGGQHVNALLRAEGLSGGEEGEAVLWIVSADDDAAVLAGPLSTEVVFQTADGYDLPADGKIYAYTRTLIVDNPDAILDREVELRVQVSLTDGRVARAWHRGVGAWLPDDYRDSLRQDAGVADDTGR